MAARQQEHGNTISQSIHKLNEEKHQRIPKAICFCAPCGRIRHHSHKTCWNEQTCEDQTEGHPRSLQTTKAPGSSQGKYRRFSGLRCFCKATNPLQLPERFAERWDGHRAGRPIAQQNHTYNCTNCNQAHEHRAVFSQSPEKDRHPSWNCKCCCPNDLCPHQPPKAAAAVCLIRRLLQKTQAREDQHLHPKQARQIQKDPAEVQDIKRRNSPVVCVWKKAVTAELWRITRIIFTKRSGVLRICHAERA